MKRYRGIAQFGLICWVALIGLSLGDVVLAADAGLASGEPPVRVLSLDEALALAEAQNHDIRKAREYSNWVYGKYMEERAQALPQISVNSGVQREFARDRREGILSLDPADPFVPSTIRRTTDAASFEFGVTQPLFTWGKLSAAIRAAQMGLASADEQLRLYRQAAIKDVSAAFYDILLVKALAEIADQNLSQRERHWQEARKKFALGTATQYDVLAAQVAVANARPEVIRLWNAVRLARDRLQFLLGTGCGQVDARGSLEVVAEPSPGYDEVLRIAMERRPEVRALEIVIGINTQLVEIARAGDKPNIFFSGTYGQYKAEFDPDSVSNESWSAGIFLSFPLFDGFRTRGKVMQSRSDLATSRIEMTKLKDAIAVEARGALDQVVEALAIITALEGTVRQAEELLAMAEKGFEYGVKTRLEVEDAQLNLNASRGSLARAARDYRVARTHLAWVQGNLGEADAAPTPGR